MKKSNSASDIQRYLKLFRIVKITAMLVFVFTIQSFASSYAQSTRLNLSMENATIEDVINTIENKTEFYFMLRADKDILDTKVNINCKNALITDVLDQLLKDTDYGYKIIDRYIAVSKNLAESKGEQQQKPVSGIVTDQNKQPLPGVTVIIKGTTNGTVTNADGKYTLANIPNNATLQYSFVGMKAQEVNYTGQQTINIELTPETIGLEEVVAVGYGVQKKVNLTGSIASVNADDIIATKNENVENMLAGKIAGVRVVQKTGEPGAYNTNFQIRGMGTPLVIIDGIPRENMNRLDPNEIESVSVLKDASASIYGVRAANGVVLVTTKKGAKGEVTMGYNGSYGWQQGTGLPESADAVGYMTLMNENNINNGQDPIYSQDEINAYLNGTKKSSDWPGVAIDEFAPQTQHNISASGGTEKVDYFLNFGYLKQDGLWKSGDLNYDRFNIRSNVSAQLTKRLKAEFLIGGMKDNKNQPYHDSWLVYKSTWTQVPLWPIYANDNPNYLYSAADGDHPLAITDADISGYKKFNKRIFQSSFSLSYDIPFVEGLTAKGLYSYDYISDTEKAYKKAYTLYTYDESTSSYNEHINQSPSTIQRSLTERENTLMQLSLSYSNVFKESHNVSALLLYEESTGKMDNFYALREFSMDAVDQLFAGNSTNQQGSMDVDDLWEIANKGLVGKFNYNYKSKYLAEISFRYDGSSKFEKDNQWGFFPAVSVGWRMSEEPFIKNNLPSIDNLKLRTSYGVMGDDNASSYQFLTGFNYPDGGFVFGDNFVNAVSSRGMSNPNITWYTAKTLNLGLDAQMWEGLFGLQIDVFSRDRDGLLASRLLSLPGTVGAALPQENLEGDFTKGIDLVVSHRNNVGDFNYMVSGNISYTRTKWQYKEIANQTNSYNNWRNNYTDRYNNIWWAYGYEGQFQSFEDAYNSPIQDNRGNDIINPGDYKYVDWNEDGVIDGLDYYPVATSGYPMLSFGLTLNAEWKGFDINALFQGNAMSNVDYPEQLKQPLYWDRNALNQFTDRWHLTDPNDPNSEWISGYYPSTNTKWTTNYWGSERYVQDASYLRLKSLEIGYSLPDKILTKAGIQKVRLYVSGYNLYTWTGIKYLDPEHPSDTYGYLYPLVKTYNFGINVTF
ncbi:TonB-linked outer membrane protein, SusC/RagA family [Mariniphaga anaerophila]|uniref:TonB-linked outer membrane protein, SusC/RagA family n=1 Tax=Mariniphaga anaerophila TaxID=1484053 RepID=A0A1M5EMX4_9BACT|nr:TonB-dependent receptor [Mariniphaga anaerophila]SHF80494.1 TonB-linked outer membrane protein, SusC/RagA family [Mariniphaga anaerophila]